MLGYLDTSSKLNTGVCYGSPASSTTGSVSTSTGTFATSSTNLDRITRDITKGYESDVELINNYLERGYKVEAMEAYEALNKAIEETTKDYNYSLSDGQIKTIQNEAYNSITGQTFKSAFEEGTKSPFVTGLLEGIPIVGCFAESYSDIEAMSKVAGKKVRLIDKASEYLGSFISGAASLAILGTVFGVGGIVGAAIGGAWGLGQNIIKGCINKNPQA